MQGVRADDEGQQGEAVEDRFLARDRDEKRGADGEDEADNAPDDVEFMHGHAPVLKSRLSYRYMRRDQSRALTCRCPRWRSGCRRWTGSGA